MILSPRLKLIADMTEGKSVADIGTDHGKLVIDLVNRGKVLYAVASDVGKGPVSACKKNVKASGLSDKISIRLGNGLDTIDCDEVETVVIAGMGGELISEIINSGSDKITDKTQLVLQPMTAGDALRIYLTCNGYVICDERAVCEEEKIYTVISVRKGKSTPRSGGKAIISPALLVHKEQNTTRYIQRELERLQKKLYGMQNATVADNDGISHVKTLVTEVEEMYELAKNY
jgi:tRNA (adenine22-N1)-methyltransferase